MVSFWWGFWPRLSDSVDSWLDLPEAIRKLIDGAIRDAYQAGLIQGAVAGVAAVLVLNLIFGRKN